MPRNGSRWPGDLSMRGDSRTAEPRIQLQTCPHCLCHGLGRPQPKLLTLGERFGLDLAKYDVHLVGMDASGRVVLRRHLTKLALLRLTANLPNRYGGLFRLPLSRPGLAGAGARAAPDAPQVLEAICQEGTVSCFPIHLFVICGLPPLDSDIELLFARRRLLTYATESIVPACSLTRPISCPTHRSSYPDPGRLRDPACTW